MAALEALQNPTGLTSNIEDNQKAFSHYPGPYGLEKCAEEDTMVK